MASSVRNFVVQNGTTIYLTNKELLAEVKNSKQKGRMSDLLARMLQLMCARYARKGNFVNYSYNEDMQSFAMMMLLRTWTAFNPEKGSNPFAFFTQCIKNSFIQYLKHEQRQRSVRDLLLISQGLNPSYGFSESGDKESTITDEQDFEQITRQAEVTSRYAYVESVIDRDEIGREIEREYVEPDTDAEIEVEVEQITDNPPTE